MTVTMARGRWPARELQSLSRRQLAILTTIYESIRDTGVQPSVREMARRTGIGTSNGVECHLRALALKGWIERSGMGCSRSVRLIRKPTGEPFDGFADKPAADGRDEVITPDNGDRHDPQA